MSSAGAKIAEGSVVPATAESIALAVDLLRAGKLVGMPTETVYGLAADARDARAVAGIFAAKGRPADHPLIVHLPDADHLPGWVRSIPKEAVALARAFWPGPLTLILPRADGVPDAVTGGQDTVGVRVPNHPVALALLRAFDSGIAAPSANRFGRISPTTAGHVREELGDKVALILDGGSCDVGIESTILDLSRATPEILRPGAISAQQIASVIGRPPAVRNMLGDTETEEAEPDRHAAAGDSHADRAAAGSSGVGTVGPREGRDVKDGIARDSVRIGGSRPSDGGRAAIPRVSGSLAAHYAPSTPLQLVPAVHVAEYAATLAGEGSRVAVLARTCPDPHDARLLWHCAPEDGAGYAHDLYASLRALDVQGADFILVEALPDTSEWQAIVDRLRRAAVGSGEADET